MSRLQLKRSALKVLARADGQPFSRAALRDSLRIIFPGAPDGDLWAAVNELEEDGYLTSTTDDLAGVLTALTPKGVLKAQQLG